MGLRVAFRADVSATIGTGHLRRCHSLAMALRQLAAEVVYVARTTDAPFLETLVKDAYWLKTTDGDANTDAIETAGALGNFAPDWIVVDHYRLDATWHSIVRAKTGARVLAIDDLADRPLAPELLVDHNIGADLSYKYAGRLAPSARFLLGPRFALLEPAYATAVRCNPGRDVRSIGIFMGGSDPRNACALALRACREGAGFRGDIEIVSSPLSPYFDSLVQLCSRWPRTRLLQALPDLRAFFSRHDLQIGAGGGAALERCCVGAPTIGLAVASNQLVSLPALETQGAIVWVRSDVPPESMSDFSLDKALEDRVGHAVRQLIGDAAARRTLSERSQTLVDGRGASRVAAVMDLAVRGALTARAANAADEALLLGWANDALTRSNAFHPNAVTAREHHDWFRTRLADHEDCRLSILEAANQIPVAQVRLDRVPDGWQISYSVDAAFRGWGVGRKALEAVLKPLLEAQPDTVFTACVMLHNRASIRIFEQLGFAGGVVRDERGEYIVFTLRP